MDYSSVNVGYVVLVTHIISENIDENEQITFNGKTFDFTGPDGEFMELMEAIANKARCDYTHIPDTNYGVLSPLGSQDLYDCYDQHKTLSTFSFTKVCNLKKRVVSLGKRLRRLKIKMDIGKPLLVKHWDGR
jgi:hypothetical protein